MEKANAKVSANVTFPCMWAYIGVYLYTRVAN